MKLILSSQIFGDVDATTNAFKEIKKDVSKLKILLIATPCLPFGPERDIVELLEWGFKRENIIVFNPWEKDKFSNLDIDIVYVTGGNTFTGLKVIKDTSFDKDIINYVNNGVLYIGKSAGAHIATKNIEHILEYDENEIGTHDFEGLGLMDGILVCHYSKDRQKTYERLLKEKKYNVYSLTNKEILICNDNKVKKVSPSRFKISHFKMSRINLKEQFLKMFIEEASIDDVLYINQLLDEGNYWEINRMISIYATEVINNMALQSMEGNPTGSIYSSLDEDDEIDSQKAELYPILLLVIRFRKENNSIKKEVIKRKIQSLVEKYRNNRENMHSNR